MRPTDMTEDQFVSVFGGVYERSPWVAERAYGELSSSKKYNSAEGLAALMSEVMNRAEPEARLALIRAHPDLAGKAAIAGTLTKESHSEQKGAGLDRCSEEEYRHFSRLNIAYTNKFGFPFIIAVKGHDRVSILQAFAKRVLHDPETEFIEALRQIDQIARFRIKEILK